MKVLRIKIHQPSAFYRIHFSYRRLLTYPIPPFSTVKGLMTNLMGLKTGVKDYNDDETLSSLRSGLSMAIHGTYESMVREYIWYRSLKKKSHVTRFTSPTNRTLDGIVQHPGGQMPVTINVLDNVNLTIYIHHSDDNMLDTIQSAFENPVNRTSTISLGRAEDWLVFNDITTVTLKEAKTSAIPSYTWIPSPAWVNTHYLPGKESYEAFFHNLNCNLVKLPGFYKINSEGVRIFDYYIDVKLYEGLSFKRQTFLMDEDTPVILTTLGQCNDK
ncbi:MAG: type I-B CRISPR-associated protein Cas5 [Magnetococcales bacterium]|uniref:type I-B CRISPR-associated protein Cas5b n=1 Tax=Candidatus Magnetobacterium casense TaxID=1455061 RepID=UPI00058CAD2E|nr:type I-B CRISPR-associated protein Cas5b [Candidatus Magnetobacterium casensis]MBF0607515.1 type I-B CRISPR-associated protein Cas5 [Nitrospirota bacterium]